MDGNTDCTTRVSVTRRQGVATLAGQVDYSRMGVMHVMGTQNNALTDCICLSPPSQVAEEPAGELAIQKLDQNQVSG